MREEDRDLSEVPQVLRLAGWLKALPGRGHHKRGAVSSERQDLCSTQLTAPRSRAP